MNQEEEPPEVCPHLNPKGDCEHPDLGSTHHACVMIKDKHECPEERYEGG